MAIPWLGIGAALGGGGSLLGGLSSLFGSRGQSQADLMSLQLSTAQSMRRWELENGPALEMAGLRRAGINPMLRYGSGGSGVPMGGFTPTVAAPYNRFQGFADAIGGIGESVSSAFRSFAGGERDTAETSRTRAEVALRLPAEVARIQADTSLTYQQRKNAIVERGRILADTLLTEAQARLPAAQMEVFRAQIGLMGAQTVLAEWQQALTAAQSDVAGATYDRETAAAVSATVQSQRDLTQWVHDRALYEDAVVGFILRSLRAVSGAVQGR